MFVRTAYHSKRANEKKRNIKKTNISEDERKSSACSSARRVAVKKIRKQISGKESAQKRARRATQM